MLARSVANKLNPWLLRFGVRTMLDINLFREEKGHNPEIIRESQRRRFADVELVDQIIALDKEWRSRKCIIPGFEYHFCN